MRAIIGGLLLGAVMAHGGVTPECWEFWGVTGIVWTLVNLAQKGRL